MKRLFVFFLSFFLFTFHFLLIPRVDAQEGWVIDNFRSVLDIQRSGIVKVTEEIAVNFGTLSKHGIYRDLPIAYRTDDGQDIYTTITVEDVTRDGGPEKHQETRNENNLRIKIGDANKTISGKHTYFITYEATGILRGFSDHDELYWNVTGNNWPVTIAKASALVLLPNPAITQVKCLEGTAGSQDECRAFLAESRNEATFTSSKLLFAGEGLTVVVGYQKGIVPLLTVARPKTLVERMVEPASLLFLGVMLVGAVGIAFFLWLRNGRDYSFIRRSVLDKSEGERLRGIGEHETVVVEYTPPDRLRPAEIGVLTDERADTLDVVATIIDLAGRGYLSITEIPKSWMFGSTDYLLKKSAKGPLRPRSEASEISPFQGGKKADTSDLVSYEKLLFDRLFGGKDEVKVSALKQTFYSDLAEVKKSLYEGVVSEKLFPKNPESMRVKYVVIGIITGATGFFALTNGVSRENVFIIDFGIGLLATGLFLLILSPFMSRRSALGREMYRRVKGYQLFISTAEKYRQRFFEKKNLFNEVLPYAIVFGLTAKFAQAMKDIGLPEKQMATGWYYGASAFNYGSFSSSMNSFATSMSSAIVSAPKSSGFSSSGSSGGGFGGGGGGSW